MRKLLVPFLIVITLAFAYKTEDQDARECRAVDGVVEEYNLPHQDTTFRCYIDGELDREWKHVDGENVLIWGS